ncbi:MAG: hypothetical protein ABI867_15890, partial [Kofleriaceae bacterium]
VDPKSTALRSTCSNAGPYTATWLGWRLGHFTTVRGYSEIATLEGWHVLRPSGPGRLMAIHDTGCSSRFEISALKRAKRHADGVLIPLEQEMHLEVEDRSVIDAMKQALESESSISIDKVLELLHIGERVRWPEGLADARFVDVKKLRRDWGARAVAAMARYAQYLPVALADGVRALAGF